MLVRRAAEILELLDPRVDILDPARQQIANLSARWRLVSPPLLPSQQLLDIFERQPERLRLFDESHLIDDRVRVNSEPAIRSLSNAVAARVTKVGPALGDHVRRGQTPAEIDSPALAEAQTRSVSAKAMLDAHDRELQRAQKLVEIGAASRQELERIHAEHAAQSAAVQSARSQLELLGLSPSTLDGLTAGQGVTAAISVPGPLTTL